MPPIPPELAAAAATARAPAAAPPSPPPPVPDLRQLWRQPLSHESAQGAADDDRGARLPHSTHSNAPAAVSCASNGQCSARAPD
eukprot:SAG25_NODE_458_length_7855_cov_911.815111_6_plen_84_part_00